MAELSVMKRRSVIRFFSGPHLTNKEAFTVLCSVVKQLGSSRALKCRGKHEIVEFFPYSSRALNHFLSALQENRAQSRFRFVL